MIIGIDPGLSGALAFYSNGLATLDMPTTERKVGGKLKRELDLARIAEELAKASNFAEFAVIEAVNAMPAVGQGGKRRGMGATSAFSFGKAYGSLLGILAALKIRYYAVHPMVWKRHFNLIGQPKDASRGTASRLLPQCSHQWPLKKHDGRAEAALLALYGLQVLLPAQNSDVPANYGGTD